MSRVLAAIRSAQGASEDAPLVGRLATRAAATARFSRVRSGSRIVWPSSGRARLERFELPSAGRGEVTVELIATAVSPGTERAQYLRLPNARPRFPHYPGFSGAGRIVDRGRGAPFAVGDVVAVPRAPHASLVTAPASEVYAVPHGVTAAQAALVYLGIIAAYGVERCELEPGQTVCVIGSGPIGLLAQRIAAARGAKVLVATRADRDRADEIGADAVIDAAGQEDTLEFAVAAAGEGARVVLLGSPRGPQRLPLVAIRDRRLTLAGAHISRLARERKETGRDDFRRFADEYLSGVQAGRIDVSDLLGERLDPREPELVYRRLAATTLRSGHFDWTLVPSLERHTTASLVPRRPDGRAPLAAPARARATGKPLGFAVIGCGDIGAENAAAVAEARNGRVVACFDVVPALAAAAAERHGAVASRGLDDALSLPGVDAVVISVPHSAHEEVAVAALARGLHVVIEKPVAHDLASARRIAVAASQSDAVASVCLPFRYEAAMLAAQALVGAHALGELRGSTITALADKPPSYWLGGYSGRAASGWRASRAVAGGGILIMNATHLIDQVLLLTGASVEEVFALALQTDETGEVEDSISVSLRYAGGAVGSIVGTSSARGGSSASGLTVWGTQGQIVLDDHPRAFTLHGADVGTGRWLELATIDEVDPRVVYFERFAETVQNGTPPEISLSSGIAVQEIIEAAYRSAETGRPIRIEELR